MMLEPTPIEEGGRDADINLLKALFKAITPPPQKKTFQKARTRFFMSIFKAGLNSNEFL